MKLLIVLLLFFGCMLPLYGGKTVSKLRTQYSLFKVASGCSYIITSAYRSKRHNKRVGGSVRSFHLKGMAYDLVVVKGCSMSRFDLFKLASQYFNGVIFYDDHIHLDIRGNNRKYHNIRSKE